MTYPHLDRYIASLPEGLSSFPGCLAKAASLLGLRAKLLDARRMPEELHRYLVETFPKNEWIPETHVNAMMLAVRDHYFGHGSEGVVAFLAWVRARSLELYGSPLYKAVFFVLSPERLIRGAAQRWSLFRKGTTLEVIDDTARRVVLRLSHPEGLHEPHSRAGLAVGIEAAVASAGGRNAQVEVVEVAARYFDMVVTWS